MAQPDASGMLRDFVRDYGERAFQFAYRLSGNIEEAKDLVQEAFYRVLKNWGSYDPSRPLEAWFFTILRHLFLDGRKRSERRRAVSLGAAAAGDGEEGGTLEELLPGQETAVAEELERRESLAALRSAMEGLGCEQRAVLTLCDMEGLSYEEISQVLELPVGTVRSRLSRARAELRRRLAREIGARP